MANEDKIEDYIRQLEELFEKYDDFIKEIDTFQMDDKYKGGQQKHFITIKLKTTKKEYLRAQQRRL